MAGNLEQVGAQNEPPSLTRAQRAAVIFSLLGESVTKRMISMFNLADIHHIEAVMETVPKLTRRDSVAIIAEFLTELQQMTGGVMGGRPMVEKFRQTVLGETGDTAAPAEGDRLRLLPQAGVSTWSRLENLDPGEVAEYLDTLPPNLIASVLRRVAPSFSAELIGKLDETRLGPTLAELLSDLKGDGEIDTMVEQMIKEDLIATADASSDSEAEEQIGQIGEVMSLLPATKREKLLAFLREQYSQQLDLVERQMLDVARLPDVLPVKFVPILTREFEEKELVDMLHVMKSDYPDVFEFLIGNISSRLADSIRNQLEGRATPDGDTCEALVRKFTTRLLELRRNNTIVLNT